MANPAKAQAKVDKARARAAEETETAQAKAERKIARVRADLAVTEAKIQARLEKVTQKADRKLMARGGGTDPGPAAEMLLSEKAERRARSKKR
jgi:hypothetical protein